LLIQIKEIGLAVYGYIFALLSAISWGFSNIFIKKSVLLNPFDQQIILFSVTGIIAAIFICSKGENFLGPKNSRKLLIFRGLLGSLGYTCLILSLKLISPANCCVISNVGILLTAILSRFILKEKLGTSHIIALILTISGIVMMTVGKRSSNLNKTNTIQPDVTIGTEPLFNSELIYLVGTFFALFATSFFSGVNIVLKLLNNIDIDWSVSVIYSVYVGLPLAVIYRLASIPFIDINEYLKNGIDLLLIDLICFVAASVFDAIGLILLNIALKYEDPTKITIVRTSNIFFVFLFQYFILNIKFEIFSIIGAIFIGIASLTVLIMNVLEKKVFTDASNSILKRIIFVKF
jgi:drug/metabolite transporter (DMT)-like permease